MRFFFPVAPLACLYLWRGGRVFIAIAFRKSNVFTLLSFLLSLFLAIVATISSWGMTALQPKLVTIFWVVMALVSAQMVWRCQDRLRSVLGSILIGLRVTGKKFPRPLFIGVLLISAMLIMSGITQDIIIQDENINFDITRQGFYPDIIAAEWIVDHTPSSAVIMARYTGLTYHYSRHKVIWFPPSSDPEVLIKGIRKYHVKFIIIVERPPIEYFLPPEGASFQKLLDKYPGTFYLADRGPRFRIYGVSGEKKDT
jgi:hypothetical protein